MCLCVSVLQIVHHEFMTSESARKRYWARSIVGYSPFANAEPNAGKCLCLRVEIMHSCDLTCTI